MDAANSRTWRLFFTKANDVAMLNPLIRIASASKTFPDVAQSRIGVPFFLDDLGHPHTLANAFFSSRTMRNRAENTNIKYARSLRVWFNFLELRGCSWDTASDDDVFDYKFWRRTDSRNPNPVQGATWAADLAAISVFDRWASEFSNIHSGLADTLRSAKDRTYQGWRGSTVGGGQAVMRSAFGRAGASSVRSSDVKWFSPGAYARWRDTGVLGFDRHGTEKVRWRPRNEERDVAFVNGLYGSGLRIQEWSTVILSEIPATDTTRRYQGIELSDACAKGGHGHRYWQNVEALNSLDIYTEGPRAAAVREAHRTGAYEQIVGRQTLIDVRADGALVVVDDRGIESSKSSSELTPAQRARLFIETPDGLEPVFVWLNESGLPRPTRSWTKTFERANKRVALAGFEQLRCHPHMLRHSFALKWYAVGRLAWESKLSHLSDEQARDFREQFGNTWLLVQTMLGHSDVNTTMNFYLEPFRYLDVELLLEHGGSDLATEALLGVLRNNPRVQLDQAKLEEALR